MSERNVAMLEAHRSGESYSSIARRHGISGPRVKQIIEREIWKEQARLDDRWPGLSTRTKSCLMRAGYKTLAQLRGLTYHDLALWTRPNGLRNFGPYALRETWAAMVAQGLADEHACPMCGRPWA